MRLFSIVLFLVFFNSVGYAQEMGFQVNGVYGKSVKQEKLLLAETMKDINPGYPSSWIDAEDYVSAEISVTVGGLAKKVEGANDNLNPEQKTIIHEADLGSDIIVGVKYKAENAATSAIEIKKINFKVTIVPEIEAEYSGGKEELMKYLLENVIDSISKPDSKKIQLATVQFLVNQHGKAIDAAIIKSSETKEIDELLLKAINNMPNWKPAENSKGEQVRQAFTFSVGNLLGC